ncbi:hypothetical protein BZG36_02523 [Bifiguratus adelaidae]|uniref:Diphthamide biosynthesis protein 4 n=1 Tax=Bifiguratus adelaidae TaxID=1938954 RepID=A0A261Y2N4_9FUNG|nr:hypothetical protein BZG36_02523 [Bifiguratus adelaidae]
MATHYEVLQVAENAPLGTIKQSFQRLVLLHHPDKNIDHGFSEEEIIEGGINRILDAWNVLKSAERRKSYDEKLRVLRSKAALNAITNDIDLEDMDYDASTGSYTYPCRCSGAFMITETDLENGVEMVTCDMCSIRVRILYDVLEGD